MSEENKKSEVTSERKIIRAFFDSYRVLSWFFVGSVCVAIFYTCSMAFKLPEAFPGGSAILTFFNNLALALIANTLFCYFQVHRPSYLRKLKIYKVVRQTLAQIVYQINARISHVYSQQYNKYANFKDMTSDELNSLFTDMLSNKSNTAKSFDKNVILTESYSNLDALCISCISVSDMCSHILFSYSSDLDEDILSILEKIYKSHFISFFCNYATRYKADSSWINYFILVQGVYTEQLQEPYIQLCHYLENNT